MRTFPQLPEIVFESRASTKLSVCHYLRRFPPTPLSALSAHLFRWIGIEKKKKPDMVHFPGHHYSLGYHTRRFSSLHPSEGITTHLLAPFVGRTARVLYRVSWCAKNKNM